MVAMSTDEPGKLENKTRRPLLQIKLIGKQWRTGLDVSFEILTSRNFLRTPGDSEFRGHERRDNGLGIY